MTYLLAGLLLASASQLPIGVSAFLFLISVHTVHVTETDKLIIAVISAFQSIRTLAVLVTR